MMREQIETRKLPCKITESERTAFGNESADLVYLINLQGDELKTHAAGKRAEIKQMQDRLEEVSSIVRTGEEHREVEVTIRFIHSRGTAQIVRVDTGQVVEERPMTMGEKQLALDMPPLDIPKE